MSVSEKLREFFYESGIQKKRFAQKIGISQNCLSQVLNGLTLLPMHCWVKTVELTSGHVSIGLLLKEKLQRFPYIIVKEGKDPHKCEVKIDIEK